MSSLSKTRMGAKPWFYETVMAGPSDEQAFDSKLDLPSAPGQNYALLIVLRLYLHQITPEHAIPGLHFAVHPDWDKKPNLIRDWPAADWTNFTNSVRKLAALWDSKFWLVPPSEVGWFDVGWGGSQMRPNIRCEFRLEVVPSKYGAHRTVDAVNLATGNFFRSDDGTFTSADAGGPKSYNVPDQTGATITTQHQTIPHETGHLLGLDHINQLRNDLNCGIAIAIDRTNQRNQSNARYFPPLVPDFKFRGGIGAPVCYGFGGTADAINNIMGYGTRFTSEEAQPWLDRLPEHLALDGQDAFDFAFNHAKWTVVMSDTPPRVVH